MRRAIAAGTELGGGERRELVRFAIDGHWRLGVRLPSLTRAAAAGVRLFQGEAELYRLATSICPLHIADRFDRTQIASESSPVAHGHWCAKHVCLS